jgi:hypothetical protein
MVRSLPPSSRSAMFFNTIEDPDYLETGRTHPSRLSNTTQLAEGCVRTLTSPPEIDDVPDPQGVDVRELRFGRLTGSGDPAIKPTPRSAIMTKASGSTGPVNSPSGRNRSATLAQSRPGIRRRIVSVSRRVGLFQTSCKCPYRTAARMRAAALLLLKPAATNTLVSITTPFMQSPCCERSVGRPRDRMEEATACAIDSGSSFRNPSTARGDILANRFRGSSDVD